MNWVIIFLVVNTVNSHIEVDSDNPPFGKFAYKKDCETVVQFLNQQAICLPEYVAEQVTGKHAVWRKTN